MRILRDGVNINDPSTVQNVIVGQRINLSVQVIGGTPLSYQWTVPEKTIKGFVLGTQVVAGAYQSGAPAPVEGLNTDATNFIFYHGGGADASQQVKVLITFPGLYPIQAIANFDVKKPTSLLKQTGGTSKVNNTPPAPKFYLGGVTSGANPDAGILIERISSNIPSGFSGQGRFAQLITRTIKRERVGQPIQTETTLISLDGCFPYNPFNDHLDDTPDIQLEGDTTGPSPVHIIYDFVEYDGTWDVYLIFKPNGTNSDWVPIRKLTWSWHATATLVTGSNPRTWIPFQFTAPGSANPAGENTTDYPTWVRVSVSNQAC